MTNDARNIELDKRVDLIIAKKDKIEKELEKKTKLANETPWLTSCKSTQLSINLQVAAISQVVDFVAQLQSIENQKVSALKFLEIPEDQHEALSLNFEGYPLKAWFSDAKRRIRLIEVRDLTDRVRKVASQLQTVKSELQKRNDAISDLEDLLKD